MASHSQRPQPGRRRHNRAGLPRLALLPLAVLVCVNTACAWEMQLDAAAYDSPHFKELAQKGEIHVDGLDGPIMPQFAWGFERGFERRDVEASTVEESTSVVSFTTLSSSASHSHTSTASTESAATTSSFTSPSPSSKSSSATETTHSTSSRTTASPTTTALPQPFDQSLGTNFTSSSCPAFFDSFLSNATFISCLPVSLLLQNSQSFFAAEQDPPLLIRTLATACSASLAVCSPLMASLAEQLISSANCGADYADQNPLVGQAYNGFLAYEPIYMATCLKSVSAQSPTTYCFADAITNTTNPSDAYPYFTALGLNLPSVAHPTCSTCLRSTMAIFAEYAQVAGQPLASTYISCAKQVDSSCGASFANTAVKTASTTATASDAVAALELQSRRFYFAFAGALAAASLLL